MATPSKPQRGARIGAAQKLKKAMLSTRPNPFTTLVENTVDAYTASGDGAVEDVRRILADLRRQYDEVHNEGERKEQECLRLREAVRQAESNFSTRSEDAYKYEDQKVSLSRQLEETTESITEALTNRKVYQHMLERLKKERALLKQKLVQMEAHLTRKQSEHEDKLAQTRLAKQHPAQGLRALAPRGCHGGRERGLQRERRAPEEALGGGEAWRELPAEDHLRAGGEVPGHRGRLPEDPRGDGPDGRDGHRAQVPEPRRGARAAQVRGEGGGDEARVTARGVRALQARDGGHHVRQRERRDAEDLPGGGGLRVPPEQVPVRPPVLARAPAQDHAHPGADEVLEPAHEPVAARL